MKPDRKMELVPHPDYGGPYLITWGRGFCRNDLQALHTISDEDIEDRLDKYFANFRLTLDERGPGLVDSVGEWHAMPAGMARMVTLNMHGPVHGTPGYLHSDRMKRLVFLDREGRVLLLVPNYGWNVRELEEWAHTIGLDTEISEEEFKGDEIDRAKAFPGYQQAPNAPVGRPYFVPPPRVAFAAKVKRFLGRAKS